jgi:hypothetical protein
MPHAGRIFANSGRKNNGIDSAHNRCVGTDIFAHPMRVDMDSQTRRFITTGRSGLNIAQVISFSRNAGQP